MRKTSPIGRPFLKEHPAVVLSLGPSGLAAVRSMGRAGIRTYGFDPNPDSCGHYSRYCLAQVCPHPRYQREALLEMLIALGKSFSTPGILFFGSDAFTEFVCAFRDILSAYYRFPVPVNEMQQPLFDKRVQYEAAERLGVPYPVTFFPGAIEDVRQIQHRLVYPVFIKALRSHEWREVFRGKGFKVETPHDLIDLYENVVPTGLPTLVQSYIEGAADCILSFATYVDENGQCLGSITYRKLRQYPPEAGVGTLTESCHDAEVCETALRLLEGLRYRGIADIEFKKDARTGKLMLIEVNTRLFVQAELASSCGVDLALLQYLDLTGQHPPARDGFRENVIWLNPGPDLRAFRELRRTGHASWKSLLKSWLRIRSHAVFAWDDPLPFCVQAIRFVRRALSSIHRTVHFTRIPRGEASPTCTREEPPRHARDVRRLLEDASSRNPAQANTSRDLHRH